MTNMSYADYMIAGAAAFGCLGVCSAADMQPSDAGKAGRKPNVILFLADDLGWSDVGCYGSRFYETPNIDRLAEEGVRFTQAYSSCSVSSPARASIMTGRYPAGIGLTDWLPGRGDHQFQRLETVRTVQQLPLDESTIAEELHENGWRTAIFGKWHVGEGQYRPTERGFDVHVPGEWLVGWPKHYNYPFQMNGFDGRPGEYLTDRLTDEALEYIEENADAPFFLFMSHFAVHDPMEGRADLVEKYRKKLAEMPEQEGEPYILEGNPDDERPASREDLDSLLHTPDHAGYRVFPDRTVKIKQFQDNVEFAAMVEAMDESLGRIVEKLDELGLRENTVIIFASDNGGMSAANFCNPRHVADPSRLDKEYSTSNLPLRGGKGWLYEGGIRIPMIVSMPGAGHNGEECDVPVILNDLFPTTMDLAGLQISEDKTVDGVSIVPLLDGRRIQDRNLYWHFPHYSNHGMQSPGGAVRSGRYKLLEYYENGTVQLFDLEKDPGEQNDLSARKPRIAERLRNELHEWKKEVNAKENRPNPKYTGKFPL